MNLRPHWKGLSEVRKKPKNPMKGLYKQKTTTGWPRSQAIERSMDKEFLRIKAENHERF
jgi:hypothetical protein